MEKKSMKGWLYLLPALVIITVFTLYPLVKAFSMSIMLNYDMVHNTFTGYGFDAYQKVLTDKTFHKALLNTTIYSRGVVPCSIILSLLIAAMINGTKKTKGLFHTIYFLPYVTSVIAIGIVWSWIYNSRYGLLNSIMGLFGMEPIQWLNKPKYALPALIIFAVWKSMAFNIMVFLAGLQTIPKDVYDAGFFISWGETKPKDTRNYLPTSYKYYKETTITHQVKQTVFKLLKYNNDTRYGKDGA